MQQRTEGYELERLAAIRQRIVDASSRKLPKSLDQVVNDTATLKALQQKADSLAAKSTIPRLSRSDIDRAAPNR